MPYQRDGTTAMLVSEAVAAMLATETEEAADSPFTRLVTEAAERAGRVFRRGDGTLILRDESGRTLFQCCAVATPTPSPEQVRKGRIPVEAAGCRWFS